MAKATIENLDDWRNQIESLEDWKAKVNRELVNTELEAAQLRVLLGNIDEEIAGIKQWN